MYDNWHEAWPLADAQAAVEQQEGCGDCPDLEDCKREGACVKHLELDDDEPAI